MKPVLNSLEKIPAPERGGERTPEKREYQVEQPVEKNEVKPDLPIADLPRSNSAPAPSDHQAIQTKAIRDILSQDLAEIYTNLPEASKQEVKIKGIETARQINTMLNELKIQTKKISDLIRRWLALIPGMNKFFLEQEVKIKTDKIINLKK